MDGIIPSYPSDLTDVEWDAVRHLIPGSRPIGADRRMSMRAVVNAIFYRRRSGCPWRMLPHDYPHWRTVYGYFRQWQRDGTWKRIETARHGVRRAPRRPDTSPVATDLRARA
jgi:putative transposase